MRPELWWTSLLIGLIVFGALPYLAISLLRDLYKAHSDLSNLFGSVSLFSAFIASMTIIVGMIGITLLHRRAVAAEKTANIASETATNVLLKEATEMISHDNDISVYGGLSTAKKLAEDFPSEYAKRVSAILLEKLRRLAHDDWASHKYPSKKALMPRLGRSVFFDTAVTLDSIVNCISQETPALQFSHALFRDKICAPIQCKLELRECIFKETVFHGMSFSTKIEGSVIDKLVFINCTFDKIDMHLTSEKNCQIVFKNCEITSTGLVRVNNQLISPERLGFSSIAVGHIPYN